MTGNRSLAVFAGVQTFKYRQSSLTPSGEPMNFSMLGSCMQAGAYALVFFTPLHAATGCGFFQRRSPTGGAANGMPLNDATPFVAVPSTWPPLTRAVVTCAFAARLSAHSDAAAATTFFQQGMLSLPPVGNRRIIRPASRGRQRQTDSAHQCRRCAAPI